MYSISRESSLQWSGVNQKNARNIAHPMITTYPMTLRRSGSSPQKRNPRNAAKMI